MEIWKNRLSYRVFFGIDSACLLLILAVQAAAFYFFFNQPYRVVFVIMDVLCILTFVITMFFSYNYFTHSAEDSETDNSFVTVVKKQLKKMDFGILPMSYVCWLVYIFILVWKTYVIVGPLENTDLPNATVISSCVGQNTTTCQFIEYAGGKWQKTVLQVCLALATPVFMLLIEGHNWHRRSSESYVYVTDMCKKTGIEIFDSVEIISLLIERNDMSPTWERIIFHLATLNFILPTVLLYQLNITNFGVKKSIRSFRLNIMHNILRIVAINIPFFIARFNTWTVTMETSVFIMKNLFYVVLSVRELYCDIWLYIKPNIPAAKSGNEEIPLNQNDGTTQTDGSKLTARL